MLKHSLLGASALALLASAPAFAQSRVIAAADKVAAENAPLGVRAGSFLVIPKIDVEEEYNDNIYATTNNTESDFITTVRPEVAVKSNWSRHALNAVARVEGKRFADKDSEDVDNYSVALDGRADVMRNTTIGGGISMARSHEERGDPNSIGTGREPTQVDTLVARVGAARELGRFNARIDSEARNLDYKNGVTAANAVIDNDLRDRNEYDQSLRLGYRVTPEVEAFVRGTLDTRAYDRKGGATVLRSNHGTTAVAGAVFDITGKTKAEAFAGMTDRNYVNSALKDLSEAVWGGKVTWNLSDLTTLKAGVARSIEETTLGASSGYVATNYDVSAEHALRRNVVLSAKTGFSNSEYKGFAANQREDQSYYVGAGADYWLNRCLKLGATYMFRNRDSNATGGDFSRNTVMVRLTGTY